MLRSSFSPSSSSKKQTSLLKFFGGSANDPSESPTNRGLPNTKKTCLRDSLESEQDVWNNCPSGTEEGYLVANLLQVEAGAKVLSTFTNLGELDIDHSLKLNHVARSTSKNISTSLLDSLASDNTPPPNPSSERYEWLVNIKDADGRPTDHPNYNSKTLYIPSHAWPRFTPFERQYWEIKKDLFDTIVFFKKGKFYELYETDADVACQEFDLKLIERHNSRMAGVPESSFELWASKFISRGYKVARVDQMETAIAKTIREKDKAGEEKNDKVVRRELQCVLTAGTVVDHCMLSPNSASYCVAFKNVGTAGSQLFGAAILDAATCSIKLCDFSDDCSFRNLESLLVKFQPKEIVIEKGVFPTEALDILKGHLSQCAIVEAISVSEFPPKKTFVDYVMIKASSLTGRVNIDDPSFEALGALVWYLRSLKLEFDILSEGTIDYLDGKEGCMLLDGQSLHSLDAISLGRDSSLQRGKKCRKSSLFDSLDSCCTPFGKRLLYSWLCKPLLDPIAIESRLDVADFFMENTELLGRLRTALKSLPDLERALGRIKMKKIRVKDFISTLDGIKNSLRIRNYLMEAGKLPHIMGTIVNKISGFDDLIHYFLNAFDREVALKEGVIVPSPGIIKEYDLINEKLGTIKNDLNNYRLEQESRLRVRGIHYKDVGRDLFQLELPGDLSPPQEYVLMSKTKNVRRYWTPKIKVLVKDYQEWEERRKLALQRVYEDLLNEFTKHTASWRTLVDSLAQIDCLLNLSEFAKHLEAPKCRPVIITEGDTSLLFAKSLRHPCFEASEFIANDITFDQKTRVLLLTGPNMGGKSTLLKQISLAVILAQIGTYVPAREFWLTPVDRIFTRLGANDNLLAGKSTFMVELLDTAKIIKEATSRSLILLDELGRGTSTFDGMAIAHAVLLQLMEDPSPIVLFATHYRSLANTFLNQGVISCKYMDYCLESDGNRLTFLYKLVPGVSPKSFGTNVAKMAGLPLKLIDEAENAASEYEKRVSLKIN